jgi:hypothetical protein
MYVPNYDAHSETRFDIPDTVGGPTQTVCPTEFAAVAQYSHDVVDAQRIYAGPSCEVGRDREATVNKRITG